MRTFEELVAEAKAEPFSGWDFRFLEGRYLEAGTSWDYKEILGRRLKGVKSYLDLGTGGGELVFSLGPLPMLSVVTEGFPPNLQVACRRLAPLGVDVVFSFCDDNTTGGAQRGRLPFREATFDIVSDRHEAFVAAEVAKVLRPGGTFITQQVGPDNDIELVRLMDDQEPSGRRWDLDEALKQIREADLHATESGQESGRSRFLDVGAVAYYLKATGPLELKEPDPVRMERCLRRIDARIRSEGSFEVTTSRFYLVAEKRGAGLS